MAVSLSALDGARGSGRIELYDVGLQGMITLRADLSDRGIYDALHVAGFALPKPGRVAGNLFRGGALWMSPDEALLLCPYGDVEKMLGRIATQLSGFHHLASDVSDARVVLSLKGDAGALRETLAKLAPADLRAAAFPTGHVRRTRLAQIPAAIWFENDEHASVVGFRATASYLFDLLENAATPGAEVGYF